MKKILFILLFFLSLSSIGQSYKFEITDLDLYVATGGRGQCGSAQHFSIELYFDDNSHINLYCQSCGGSSNGVYSDYNWIYSNDSQKKPIKLIVDYYIHRKAAVIGCGNSVSGNKTFYFSNNECGINNFSRNFSGGGITVNYSIDTKITPIINIIPPIPNTIENKTVGQDELFNINATTGFDDSLYEWQYSKISEITEQTTQSACNWYCSGGGGGTGGVVYGLTEDECNNYVGGQYCNSAYTAGTPFTVRTWHDVLPNPSTPNFNNLTPQQLVPNYIGDIVFRIKSCNDSNPSVLYQGDPDPQYVVYHIIPSPPSLVSGDGSAVTPINETCSGDGNTGFIANFTRSLHNNEILNWNIYDANNYDPNNPSNSVAITGGSTTSLSSNNSLIVTQTTTSLGSGNYIIIFTSEISGIISNDTSANLTITNPNPVSFTLNKTDVVCYGDNGAITINVQGGLGFGYQWSLNAGQDGGGTWSSFISGNPISLPAGAYSITVRDSNGCLSGTQNIVITQPSSAITFTAPSIDDETMHNPTMNGCSDGWVAIQVSGGWGGFDINSFSCTGGTIAAYDSTSQTVTIQNLHAGTYTLTATDSEECSKDITFTLTEPPELLLSTDTTPISCNTANTPTDCTNCNQDGEITATAGGGVPPYDFYWYDANHNLVQTTMNVPSPTRPGSAQDTLTNLGAGTYYVNVVDANGITIGSTCGSNTPDDEEVNLQEPPAIVISIGHSSIHYVTCFGGNDGYIHPNYISGGTGHLTYQWLDANNNTIGTNSTVDNLAMGTYTLIVTDANGCVKRQSFNITQPTEIQITLDNIVYPTGNGLSNGAIYMSVTGGNPSYTYQWTDANGYVVGNTEDLINIGAGSYSLNVSDSNNCPMTYEQNPIAVTEPPILETTIDLYSPIKCNGDSNGALTAEDTSGGVTLQGDSYYFQWFMLQNGQYVDITRNINDDTITNLVQGTYKVRITDANGNTVEDFYTLSEPLVLRIDEAIVTNNDCYGYSDGGIEIDIEGGTTPYNYYWEDEDGNEWFTQNMDNLPAGIYDLTIVDAHQCTVSATYEVTQPSTGLDIILNSITDPSAYGTSDGAIDVTVQGGHPPYSYEWYNTTTDEFVADTEDITGLENGNYKLTVNDNTSCTATANYTVTEPALLQVSIQETQSIDCFNDNDGELQAVVTGGITPYQYEWYYIAAGETTFELLGETTQTVSNLIPSNYKVKIIDANNIEIYSNNYELTQPSELIATTNEIINVNCFGDDTGSIDINVIGGTTPYTFVWDDSNASTTEDISNLMFGVYNVLITDANGCFTTINNITITQPQEALSITNEVVTDLTGFETQNGQINLQVNGGTQPYSYQWTGPNSFSSTQAPPISNLEAGTYNLTCTDATNHCEITGTYTIRQPEQLTFSLTQTLFNICNGDDLAEIEANVTGGVTPYTYNWVYQEDTSVSLNNNNTISNLTAGTYTLTVIDHNQNEFTDNITITQNDSIVISSNSSHDLMCNGDDNGVIAIDVIGGTGSFTFIWNNGESTQNRDNLTAGSYTVTVRDGNNCSETFTFVLNEPTPLEITNIIYTDPLGNGLSNGNIEVVVAGGTPSYTYVWKDNNGNIIPNQNTSILSNVGAGTYQVLITDANGCEITEQSLELNEPEALVLDIQYDAILCNGEQTSITATVTGGVGDYHFEWLDSQNNSISTTNQTPSINAGDYQITVTDDNNISITQNIPITEPDALQINLISANNLICAGTATGSIDIEVTGGTGSYLYNWSNSNHTQDLIDIVSGTYHVEVIDENDCSITSQDFIIEESIINIQNANLNQPSIYGATDGSITIDMLGSNQEYQYQWFEEDENGDFVILSGETNTTINTLGEGSYKVIVTNSIGCTLETTYVLGQPDPLVISIQQTNTITCFNDNTASIECSTQGGVGGYQYTWYNATTNEIIVGETSSTINNLNAGTYYVIVHDLNNAQTQSNTIEITQPDEISVNTSFENSSCYNQNNGSITITVTGGTNSFLYRIKQGTDAYSDWILFTNMNSLSLTDLTPNTYYIQVKDTNDCIYNSNGSVETLLFNITEPNVLEINSSTVVTPSGYGLENGSIDIEVIGGTTPYQYQWTDANGTVLATTTNNIENLGAGSYTVNVTDANLCTYSETFILTQPDALIVSIQQTNTINCFNDNNASIECITQGGVGGYQYTWYNADTNEIIVGENTNIINNLGTGSYNVIVYDSNNIQTQSNTIEITQPDEISVNTSFENSSCYNQNNGSITITVTGGTNSFLYRIKQGTDAYSDWILFTNMNSLSLTDLTPDTYYIQVKDTNDCMYNTNGSVETLLFNITEPDVLEVSNSTVVTPSGYGLANGSIDIEVSGGTTPYQYQWTDANGTILTATTNNIENLGAGSYTVNVTDANLCTYSETFTLTQPDILQASINVQNPILCNNGEGVLEAVVQGGIPFTSSNDYSYEWYLVDDNTVLSTTNILENINAGDYYVIVTDANNNTVTSDVFTLEEPEELSLEFNASYINCGTENDWTIEVTPQGGTAPYTYSWNTGENTSSISDVQPGTYLVIVIDDNGCETMQNYTIEVPEVLELATEITAISCFDACDGEIELNITGGVPPYTINWSDDASDLVSRNNLCDGDYEVEITDQKGCVLNYEFTLENPEEIIVNINEQIVTLCSEQTLDLDITVDLPNVTYLWESDNGFYNTNPVVSLDEAGIYTAKITNEDGCEFTKQIEILLSSAGVNAQFLLTSQAFADEDVILINTSNPMGENTQWIIPEEVSIIEQTNETVTLHFPEEGLYQIGLETTQGECTALYTKNIQVNEARDFPDIGDAQTPFISEFVAYPNPNTGNFSATIVLDQPAQISLRLFNLIANTPLDDRQFNNQDNYQVDYNNLNLSSGVYYLLLETPKGSEIRKIIIE